jgi:hypothetical protein
MRISVKNEMDVVITGIFYCGTLRGYSRLVLELTSNLGEQTELIHYDVLNYGDIMGAEITQKFKVLTDELDFDTTELLGTQLTVEKSIVEKNGYTFPAFTYVKRSPEQVELQDDQIIDFDATKDKADAEWIETFPPFIQKYIRESDQYTGKEANDE